MSRMLAVADFRYQNRKATDPEFAWLLSDIGEYNEERDQKEVSLLESVRREEMKEHEARRKARKQQRGDDDSLVPEDELVMDGDPEEGALEEEDDEEEGTSRPDLLLRESARIVADMVELGSDGQLLV